MPHSPILFVGLDVHKDSIAVAYVCCGLIKTDTWIRVVR